MTDDADIVRAARLLIDRYGARAPEVAAQRAGHLVEVDQKGASAIWLRIGVRAQQLLWEARKQR